MRYAAKTDANHAHLRDHVFKVWCPVCVDTSKIGAGAGDLMILTALGSFYMVEIKDGSKPPSARKLKPSQEKLLRLFPSVFKVITNREEAEALCRT